MNISNRIGIKTKDELKLIRSAANILSEVLKELQGSLKVGMTTLDVDRLAEMYMRSRNVAPAFKGYRGFPGSICISLNDEVVHGIPSKDRVLKDGDIVSVDAGIIYRGFYADAAFSAAVGTISPDEQSLLRVTIESLYAGIDQAREGRRLSDISHAIQKHVEVNNFSVVREFVGHGIGRNLHEDPEIPNFGEPGQGPVLKEGMVFCLEPMVNLGTWKTKILQDGWTVKTQDGQPSAHYEHMIAITKGDPEVLTSW